MYLKSFRNTCSNNFNVNLVTILQNLFTTYGAITLKELKEQEDTFCANIFDTQQPLVIIFNELEELEQLVIAANNPFSGINLVNISIKLINNFNDFEKGLTSWYKQPLIEHRMINLKLHFEREYQALKRVRGITTQSTYFSSISKCNDGYTF